MNHFHRDPASSGELLCEGVPLSLIAAEVGTPTYVYSRATIERHIGVWLESWHGLESGDSGQAGDHHVHHRMCFALKSCSNLSILKLFVARGAGFDIVSGGELLRALAAGAAPSTIVFSGVGKTLDELDLALTHGIGCFNVESLAELEMLESRAALLGKRAPVSLRVNPDVDAKTHPYIATGLAKAKFGIAWGDAIMAYERARALPHLEVIGIDCHIGSQLESAAPFVEALDKLLDLTLELRARGFQIRHLDIGGGLGIVYREESPPSPRDYVTAVKRQLKKRAVTDLEIITEPGRVIVGNAAVLLSRVILTKDNGETRFAVLDAGMNDLIRPALYEAYHHIEPVAAPRASRRKVDVVGPVCETGDAFAKGRELPELEAEDLVVLRSAGAYGMVMASNYNSRPRPAEVLVDGDHYTVIRRRETFADLIAHELPFSE